MRPAQAQFARDYVNQAVREHQAGNDAAASLLLRKAAKVKKGDYETQFRHALLLGQIGEEAEAIERIRKIAPDEQPGFLQGHEYMVRMLSVQLARVAAEVKDSGEPATPDRLEVQQELSRRIELHLRHIVQLEPAHVEGNRQLAKVSIARKDLPAATEHLSRIVDIDQNSRLTYASLLASQQEMSMAKRQYELAAEHHRQFIEQNPDLDEAGKVDHRLRASNALLMLRNYEEAAKTLLDNNAIPQNDRLQKALAEIFVIWSEATPADSGEGLVKKMELLDRALQLAPGDPRALQRVALIAGADGEAGERASEVLRKLLAIGRAPAIVHFILGSKAAQSGNVDKAIMHLELANKLNPNAPSTLNNLAYMIASQEEPDLDRALKLVEAAIRMEPTQADYYETRGEIYEKLKRYSEAITDLERAVGALPNRADIHRALERCYGAIGEPGLAQTHRDAAEKLEVKNAQGEQTNPLEPS